MWRNLCKQASFKKLKPSNDPSSSSSTFLSFYLPSNFPHKQDQIHLNSFYQQTISPSIGGLLPQKDTFVKNSDFLKSSNNYILSAFSNYYYSRFYASVSEAIASTESEEDVDEIQELLDQMSKENKVVMPNFHQVKQPKLVGGMGQGKYNMLRRRQIKMETEAWEEAAKEYQELLTDMCEQKLAPNLPYMKSLFLGWFEPLRNAILAEQELCKEGKNRASHAPYFDHLPADMMAVITMHKLMGLLMTGGGNGSARVVQAACQIGEAIEQEVGYEIFTSDFLLFVVGLLLIQMENMFSCIHD